LEEKMTKINTQIENRRGTFLIVQAILAVVMFFLLAVVQTANAEATRQLGDLRSQGAG
jgi:hypothetical protein